MTRAHHGIVRSRRKVWFLVQIHGHQEFGVAAAFLQTTLEQSHRLDRVQLAEYTTQAVDQLQFARVEQGSTVPASYMAPTTRFRSMISTTSFRV